jgi:Uma2 family endonuclease
MNAPLAPLVPPRPLTADDVMFLVDNGLIDPQAKFELLDGVIIPVPAKGRHHEVMRERLETWLRRRWSTPFNVMREHTLRVDDATLLDPDFVLYDAGRRIADAPLSGADIRLAIEVADSSWSYDVRRKSLKYAAFGVAEYWVIHAVKARARVFRGPGPGGYAQTIDAPPAHALSPLCAPRAKFDPSA